jgi:hypothetical protein
MPKASSSSTDCGCGAGQPATADEPALRQRAGSHKPGIRFQTILKILTRKLIDFNFIIKIFLLQRKRI